MEHVTIYSDTKTIFESIIKSEKEANFTEKWLSKHLSTDLVTNQFFSNTSIYSKTSKI